MNVLGKISSSLVSVTELMTRIAPLGCLSNGTEEYYVCSASSFLLPLQMDEGG